MNEPYVLLTRPKPDSLHLQEHLASIGIKSFISPLILIKNIYYQSDGLNIEDFDAIIITSKHTSQFLPTKLLKEKIPIFSIGTETTKSLTRHHYSVFSTANGDSASLKEDLDQFLKNTSNGKRLSFLHFGGHHISNNFRRLIMANFNVTHIDLYNAEPALSLDKDIEQALSKGQISTALFFSPRSASIFEDLCERGGLTPCLKRIQALCLAPPVLKSLDKMKWKAIDVAQQSDSHSMIEKLKEMTESGVKI